MSDNEEEMQIELNLLANSEDAFRKLDAIKMKITWDEFVKNVFQPRTSHQTHLVLRHLLRNIKNDCQTAYKNILAEHESLAEKMNEVHGFLLQHIDDYDNDLHFGGDEEREQAKSIIEGIITVLKDTFESKKSRVAAFFGPGNPCVGNLTANHPCSSLLRVYFRVSSLLFHLQEGRTKDELFPKIEKPVKKNIPSTRVTRNQKQAEGQSNNNNITPVDPYKLATLSPFITQPEKQKRSASLKTTQHRKEKTVGYEDNVGLLARPSVSGKSPRPMRLEQELSLPRTASKTTASEPNIKATSMKSKKTKTSPRTATASQKSQKSQRKPNYSKGVKKSQNKPSSSKQTKQNNSKQGSNNTNDQWSPPIPSASLEDDTSDSESDVSMNTTPGWPSYHPTSLTDQSNTLLVVDDPSSCQEMDYSIVHMQAAFAPNIPQQDHCAYDSDSHVNLSFEFDMSIVDEFNDLFPV